MEISIRDAARFYNISPNVLVVTQTQAMNMLGIKCGTLGKKLKKCEVGWTIGI